MTSSVFFSVWMLFFRAEADGCSHFHFSNAEGSGLEILVEYPVTEYIFKKRTFKSLFVKLCLRQISYYNKNNPTFLFFYWKEIVEATFLSSLFLVVNPHFFWSTNKPEDSLLNNNKHGVFDEEVGRPSLSESSDNPIVAFSKSLFGKVPLY